MRRATAGAGDGSPLHEGRAQGTPIRSGAVDCGMTPLLALTAVLASGPIEVGQMVPDVTLTDMDGKAVRLSEFRGKKVILFTWASW